MPKEPRIALVHDWLVDSGGAEQVLASLLELWPKADIFTVVSDLSGQCKRLLEGQRVNNSFIARLPFAKRWYRNYLLLMPLAVEQFDLRGYDIVISNSYAVAKGVITGPDQLHISHVCSPIRYAWDLQSQYLEESGLTKGFRSIFVRALLHYIRSWDSYTANRVDYFISISNFIARRVWKVYRRKSVVIYPPVDVQNFSLTETKEDYYLTASRMVPYKKIDLVVEAFSTMPEKKLVVIGSGPDYFKFKRKAGPNVELIGHQPLAALVNRMQHAKAFIFAAEEDFGIAPVEAQACGTPVIAYGKGGALETIIDGKTGLFFFEQNVESIVDAVNRFERHTIAFDPIMIRENAERFNKERFKREIRNFVDAKWDEFCREVRDNGSRTE